MLPPLLFAAIMAAQSQTVSAPRDPPSKPTATCAISGQISEQGSGRPLPRAQVSLAMIAAPRQVEAVADAQGHYEFTGLEPGEYALWAAPGELVATHLAQAYKATVPMDLSIQRQPNIALESGEVLTDVNIALARTLAIEGRVSDAWDEPMANVDVGVVRADGRPMFSRSVYSDDRGEFRIFALPPGRYRVCANPRSSWVRTADGKLRFVRTCHLASISESSAADVVLDAEDATGIDIRMQRSGTYSVSGSVVDAAGVSADGAMVSVVRHDHSIGANATSRGGQFSLSGLTPGPYTVWASIGGPRDPPDTRPPARDCEYGYASIEIGDADASGIVLSLWTPVKVAGRVRFEGRAPVISGRVVDDRGAAVRDAHVLLLPADQSRWRTFEVTSATSAATGAFRVGPVRPGDYVIVVAGPSVPYPDPADRARLAKLAETGERITLADEEQRTLDLHLVLDR